MWDALPHKTPPQPSRPFFLEWMDRAATGERVARAKETVTELEAKIPAVRAYHTTPQSPPWHAEGPVLTDHVERMLTGLFAIVEGESLLDIEELAREKHHHAELEELQETLREHAATLEAFALAHDIAKPVVLFFDAPRGSQGERDGYRQQDASRPRLATDEERATYRKLREAFFADHAHLSGAELCARFFDAFEITTHYDGHDRLGASDRFLAARETLSDHYRLTQRERALLTWIIRQHIDVLSFFKEGPSAEKFELLLARADQQGFDADDALDLLLAGVFLDSAVGGLVYREGKFSVDLDALWSFLKSEEAARSARRTKRRERRSARRQAAFRNMLEEVGLGSEALFRTLGVPFGPERGKLLSEIHALVREPHAPVELGAHTERLRSLIEAARARFDPRKMA